VTAPCILALPFNSKVCSSIEIEFILNPVVLLNSNKINQSLFGDFFFHLVKVTISIDFANEKKLFLTGFAHRNFILCKSCGLGFEIEGLKPKM